VPPVFRFVLDGRMTLIGTPYKSWILNRQLRKTTAIFVHRLTIMIIKNCVTRLKLQHFHCHIYCHLLTAYDNIILCVCVRACVCTCVCVSFWYLEHYCNRCAHVRRVAYYSIYAYVMQIVLCLRCSFDMLLLNKV